MFPVLRLPHLAFENIYGHLEITELILLSQCSKHIKTIIRSMEKTRGKTLELTVKEQYSLIKVLGKKRERLFAWTVDLHDSEMWVRIPPFVDTIFEGKSWRIADSMHTPGWVNATKRDRIDQDTLLVVHFFKDVFHCSIDKIEILSLGNKKIDKLLQSTSILHTARYIRIKMEDLFPAEMNFMLDTFVAEELEISGDPGWQYNYQKPVLRFPKISINPAQWITGADFMEMAETCEKIHLWVGNGITNQDLNTFIKTWLAGTNEILEKVNLCRKFISVNPQTRRDAMTTNDVFNGVKGTQINDDYDQVRVEIKRADGKQAKVIIQQGEEWRYRNFSFTVVK